jgi:hypothetical protein
MPNKPKDIKRKYLPERKAFGGRAIDNSKFYNSWKWRKKSKQYRELHSLCECNECKELKRVRPAEVVDHIRGLSYLLQNGLDPFNDVELQSMSHECHNKKSGKQRHGKKF